MDDKDEKPTQPIDEGTPEVKEEPSPGEELEEKVEETPAEPEPPEEVEDEPEEEKPRSHRENLRIQELVKKLRDQKPSEAPKLDNQHLDYKKALDADDDTIRQLEADRQSAAEFSYQRGVEKANSIQFHTRLELDAPVIATKYPQFDQHSPEFNAVAANTINEWYLASVGYDPKTDTVKNPNVRYADFVEGIMELADEMAGHKVAETKKNIAKQAANTALRPDGSSAKRLNLNQAPQSMTDEELDAMIKSAIPPKR